MEKKKEAVERSALENKIEIMAAEVANLKESNSISKQKLQ